jgi:hypothetical protein
VVPGFQGVRVAAVLPATTVRPAVIFLPAATAVRLGRVLRLGPAVRLGRVLRLGPAGRPAGSRRPWIS